MRCPRKVATGTRAAYSIPGGISLSRRMTSKISKAKLEQAAAMMPEHGLDCWIVSFARETGNRQEPLEYLIGSTVTWPSVFLLHRDGRTVVIVGSGDVGQVTGTGIWADVRGYVASPRQELVKLLDEWRPERIGVTWSEDDDTSDGITYGMYRMLQSMLEGTPHAERLVAPGNLARDGRGPKAPRHVEVVHSAITTNEEAVKRIGIIPRSGIT